MVCKFSSNAVWNMFVQTVDYVELSTHMQTRACNSVDFCYVILMSENYVLSQIINMFGQGSFLIQFYARIAVFSSYRDDGSCLFAGPLCRYQSSG